MEPKRSFDCKLSQKNNKNEVSESGNRNLSTSETERGGGGGDAIFFDMVSVTANAGSFEAPSSFDDGYDSSNSFPHSPGSSTLQYSNDGVVKRNLFRRIVARYYKMMKRNQYPDRPISARYEDLELAPVQAQETVEEKNFDKANTQVGIVSESEQLIETTLVDEDKPNENDLYADIEASRETWNRDSDFLLSIIGFAVDLANVWRFPYLCYRNGGGAFLVPYALMLIFGAVPLFYMELILGQYNRQGPISVWRICPMFKGIGFCAVLVAFYVSFYYNVIIGWALYFLVASITPELPWLHCNNTWNTIGCTDTKNNYTNTNNNTQITASLPHSPAAEYFHRAVLEMQWSDGLHEIGYPKWQLVVCLMVVYCMLYLSLFKGVKSTGLVVWATATLPYAVLTILLIRGIMLPGALKGIKYYLHPQLSRLADTRVWVDAAVQVFYSVGAGFGVHLSYASYNNFNNNCYKDCLITTLVNCFTSFFSGFVIFTYLGYMSVKQGIPISNVATEGPGLVFQVYPEAVATLPGSNVWSILFFFMLITLGIDSAMGGLECVITGLMDEFCLFFAGKKYAREIFTLCAIFVSFSVATVNVTPGGIYMFHLFDTYSAGISLLCSALFEAIAVSWFYGLERFTGDVELMLGHRPGLYWRICWKFISPTFIIGVVVFGLIYQEPLKYNDYMYPSWAEWMGWALALSSILMIPFFIILQICQAPGTLKEKIAYSITPVEEHGLLKKSKKVTRFRSRHWLYV